MNHLEERVWNLECYVSNMLKRLVPMGGEPGQVLTVLEDGTYAWSGEGGGGTDPNTFTAYWGWKGNDAMPTQSEIVNLQQSSQFPTGNKIISDFSAALSTPYFLLWAEPVTEPVKTTWYETSLNNDAIEANGVIEVKGTVGGYRVYMTSFQTSFSDPVELRPS